MQNDSKTHTMRFHYLESIVGNEGSHFKAIICAIRNTLFVSQTRQRHTSALCTLCTTGTQRVDDKRS